MGIATGCLLLLTAGAVQATTLDGQSRTGELLALTATELRLASNGAETAIAVAELMSVELGQPAEQPAAPQQIVLADGAQLGCSGFARTAREASAHSSIWGDLQLPAAAVRAVRLQAENPQFAIEWQVFQERDSEKDLLIVPRRGGNGLDFLAGIVTAISPEELSFLLDGDTIPVPATRVYGVVFARAKETGLTGGIRVIAGPRDSATARSIALVGGQFQVDTAWGQALVVAPELLSRIDFGAGRIRYLSDLPTVTERFDGIEAADGLFAGLLDRETEQLMYGPRRDTTFDKGTPLRLRGTRYARGLCLHSRTEIAFALDRRFSLLEAVVGIDDQVAFNQQRQVLLRISGDGDVLMEQLIATSDDPLPLRLDVSGLSTLTILVDFGDADSVCDWLDLADARLLLTPDGTP